MVTGVGDGARVGRRVIGAGLGGRVGVVTVTGGMMGRGVEAGANVGARDESTVLEAARV